MIACSSGHSFFVGRLLFLGGRQNLVGAALALRLWNISAYWDSTPYMESSSVMVLLLFVACFSVASSYSCIT